MNGELIKRPAYQRPLSKRPIDGTMPTSNIEEGRLTYLQDPALVFRNYLSLQVCSLHLRLTLYFGRLKKYLAYLSLIL